MPSTCTCPESSVGLMCSGLCCWPRGTGQSPTPPLAGALGALRQSLGQMVHSCHSLQACTRAAGSLGHMVRGPCAMRPGSLQCGVLLSTGGGAQAGPLETPAQQCRGDSRSFQTVALTFFLNLESDPSVKGWPPEVMDRMFFRKDCWSLSNW